MVSNVDNRVGWFLCWPGMRRILLVNPPIYDFAAYDFWLKPYGLLSVAGQLRGQAEFVLFDYLEQGRGNCGLRIDDCGLKKPLDANPQSAVRNPQSDRWGRGTIYHERIESPVPLKNIPRYFRRFDMPRPVFTNYLRATGKNFQ